MSNPCGRPLPVALSYLYPTDMLKHFPGKTSIQTQTRIKPLTSHNPALCSFNPGVKLCRDMQTRTCIQAVGKTASPRDITGISVLYSRAKG